MAKPLYLHIKDIIKKDILSGKLKVDEKLPSENDLALSYHVSRITSKRALNDLEAEGYIIRKKGLGSYVLNQNPQTIKESSKDILFIMPFPDEPSFGNYTQGILSVLENTDYRLHIKRNNENMSVEMIRNYAGVIFYPIQNKDMMDFISVLYAMDVPLVIIDKELSGTPVSSVLSNNFQGGYEACSHLLSSGLKKVRFLSSNPIEGVSTIRERYFGYLKAIKDHKIQSGTEIVYIDNDNNVTNIINWLHHEGVQGLVCENDVLAIQVMKAITDSGFSIPNDFKIIGFDDTQASKFLNPPLTTIKQNFENIGEVATRHLIDLISNNETEIKRHIIDVSLIIRESTQNKEK